MSHRLTLVTVLIVSSMIYVGFTFAMQPSNGLTSMSEPALSELSEAQQRSASYDVIDEAPPSSNDEERARRESKSRRYNGAGSDLTTMEPDMVRSLIGCGPAMPLLPTEYTPIIMLGTVVSLQPYLSEDKSNIYTEYTVHVEKYLKKDALTLPMEGDRLIVDRTGGVLRLRNGRVIQYHASGTGMARPLRVGERLVLFLNRIHDGANLMLGPGFLLRDGKAYAIGQSEGQMTLFGELTGVEKRLSQEGEFLKAVQRAIENPPSPALYSALDLKQQENEQ
jgi:hypothetical protein